MTLQEAYESLMKVSEFFVQRGQVELRAANATHDSVQKRHDMTRRRLRAANGFVVGAVNEVEKMFDDDRRNARNAGIETPQPPLPELGKKGGAR